MNPKYQAIADKWTDQDLLIDRAAACVKGAVSDCEALQPEWKMLTDAEAYDLWSQVYGGKFNAEYSKTGSEIVRKIEAAFIAKQSQPETVTVRLWRYKDVRGKLIYCCTSNTHDLGAPFPKAGGEDAEWLGDPVEIPIKEQP